MGLTARSIQEMYDKFKHIIMDDSFFYGVLIVLIAVSSFGLGRWSLIQDQQFAAVKPSMVLMQASVTGSGKENTTEEESIDPTSGEITYVGSKNGTKFHLPWCPGAKQIKEENKVYFATKTDAQKAGYTPASNCKGI